MTMQNVPWRENYLTGIRVIDDDHQMLFTIINTLIDDVRDKAVSQEIAPTISALRKYVDFHFDREEGYLAKSRYPDLANHRKMHRQLRKKMHDIEELYENNPEILDLKALCDFLSKWLIRHILGTDMAYVPYLKSPDSISNNESEILSVEVPVGTGYLVNEIANELSTSPTFSLKLKNFMDENVYTQDDLYQTDSMETFLKR